MNFHKKAISDKKWENQIPTRGRQGFHSLMVNVEIPLMSDFLRALTIEEWVCWQTYICWEEEFDSITGSFQQKSSDEKDDETDVWK